MDRPMVTSRKLLAGGGVVGPLAFIAAWAVLGARAEGYSPVSDPISELAAADATSRVPMTAGLVALGSGVTSYGLALQGRRAGPAWLAAIVTGVAALGVAATPLQPNAPDRAHGAFAAAGYAALAATPLLSAGPLARRGSRGRAAWSVAAGAVAAACLAATATAGGGGGGVLQRVGLTAGHLWIVADASDLLRRPPSSVVEGGDTP